MGTNRKPLDRNIATAFLGANLGLPGLGSIMAGRRVVGTLQLLMSLGGFALTLVFASWFLKTWKMNHELPMITIQRTGELPPGLLHHVLIGLAGMAVFAVAWLWSAFTGFQIRSKATPPPLISSLPPKY